MSSGSTHRIAAGLAAITATSFLSNDACIRDMPHPVMAGVLAPIFTNLPDWIEPATNPHHRQFFHSLLFAGGIVFALKSAYEWEPEEKHRFLRHLLLIAGSAYLIHLALDSCTKRSLPLIGK